MLDVVEATIARRAPDKQIEDIIAFQLHYNCLLWGIESVQFQEFFRQVRSRLLTNEKEARRSLAEHRRLRGRVHPRLISAADARLRCLIALSSC